MSVGHYYDLCSKNIGKPVEIREHCGKVHRGIIERVDREFVYLRPLEGSPAGGPGGPGMFLWGPVAAGALWGIGLGAIASLAFLPWFWI